MHHLTYTDDTSQGFPLCFLVPVISKSEILKEYITPFDIPPSDVLVLGLHYAQDKKKTPAAEMKEYITGEIVPVLEDMEVQYVLVADSDYFKVLTKATKIDVNLGYVMDCVFGPWKVVYVPNYRSIFYDPDKVRAKISQAMTAVVAHATETYQKPGADIIKFEEYPRSYTDIHNWLEKLLEMDKPLSIDIEAFDLKHHKAGIGTITFCWSKHEGIAFPVDYVEIPGATEAPFGKQVRNDFIRELLRDFFERYLQKAIYHSISYDVYVLIYQLYMKDILDTAGLLRGLSILLRNWDDTKLITYLATNSCAGNKLSLKDQAQEFSGNYAESEIQDITRIPLPKLLRYNLIDGLSTWYVHEKHYMTMVNDQQLDIYENLFKPATVDIIQMQLTGMPLDQKQVTKVKDILTIIANHALDSIRSSQLIQQYEYKRLEDFTNQKNNEWKKKRVTIQEMADAAKTSKSIQKETTFNPNSGPQLQELLYEMLGLPVINYTDSKQPSVDRDTLEALVNHAQTAEVKEFLLAMLDYGAVNKILTSFIPAMEDAAIGPDGWSYLSGNFNLGGTLSGRLSSSDPNLQNLPANVMMAISAALMALFGDELGPYLVKGKLSLGKLIKSCFKAPPGWLFCGLDFASLEDRISALTTKDPNKLKVYTDGYDGHCLRAYSYFGQHMPDIDPNSVASINSIESKYKNYRQDSKAPTFALTYAGTYITLMKNCGFTKELALSIEAKYQELYSVSIKWVQNKLNQASKDGYVTVAFGLRVRTPLLKQVVRGTRSTPYEAEAEARSAGNALGQSWCLLNSRASVEFMGKVRISPYRLDIRPCAQIHDAQYMLVRDDIDTVMFTNEHLVKAVQWQEDPEIAHPEVKLGGELSIFWPSWAKEITIPNHATEEEIRTVVREAVK
jgi:DNA polymerase-1